VVKVLFRNEQGALVSIIGQEPFFVPRDRYVAMQLQPPFNDLPLESEMVREASANRLRGHDGRRTARPGKRIAAPRKARS